MTATAARLSADDLSTSAASRASALLEAGRTLKICIEQGKPIDAAILRDAMTASLGGSDAEGVWCWKDAFEAVEIAQILFLQDYGPAMARKAADSARHLSMLEKIASLAPRHGRRSEASQTLQQFSTPLGLSFIAAAAAHLAPSDHVLEPSAGAGLLAIFPALTGCSLVLNEIAEMRAEMLAALFPHAHHSRHDAEAIDDLLPGEIAPSVVLMNPPFSASPGVVGRRRQATLDHLTSALRRLRDGGRLVAITAESFSPHRPSWRDAFVRLQENARVVYTAGVGGSVFAPHGAAIETRLTVIDKIPAANTADFPDCAGVFEKLAGLLASIELSVPARAAIGPAAKVAKDDACGVAHDDAPAAGAVVQSKAAPAAPAPQALLDYVPRDDRPAAAAQADGVYVPYDVEAIRIEGAAPPPSALVQSSAMASVRPPLPAYRPNLPQHLVSGGVLCDAQLEAAIYAGESHQQFLQGDYVVNEDGLWVRRAGPGDQNPVRFRKGWFLGDGTGVGKGREVSGIVLDNWLQGRRRAVWFSGSADLVEDARRDWSAVGGDPAEIVPLSKFDLGADITLESGILFATYATLRVGARQDKCARVDQIAAWFGADYDGVIIFDEAHAMANAAGDKGARGDKKPSQQGLAGLRLQNLLPNARIVYVSATGATTVANLAYASRLGLWGTDEFPFETRGEFVEAMEEGGVAAMEVIGRDLKALGLYAARSLSFHGVEYEMLVHELTPAQVDIYDAYADCYEIIHNNLEKALEASKISDPSTTYNKSARSAARSAFESSKQRFFSLLLMGMKCVSLIKAIEKNLEDGHACVVQLVSTCEALLDRRLANIPQSEWSDLVIDNSPREYVLDYIENSFPTQLFRITSDADGNEISVPVYDAQGNPVQCREAVRLKTELVEKLATLAPVPGALDQLVQHFGTDIIAEVTGRRRRIVRREKGGRARLCVEKRGARANRDDVDAFQQDRKRLLAFSDAGGTGRSFHADRDCPNQRLRVHYLLQPGWRADVAIQGLGRTNRSNQRQAPQFRPTATNVRGETRFLSTIARRLDTLGAITRGQRETGGQGLFRAEDNLESIYAKIGLRKFYVALYRGTLTCCSLDRFIACTGLRLLDRDGSLLDNLPPIHTFLNRILALRIAMQNAIFDDFLKIVQGEVEEARAAGTLDIGIETLQAEKFEIASEQVIYTHPRSGAETRAVEIIRTDKTSFLSLAEALDICKGADGKLMINAQSGRAAVVTDAPGFVRDDGAIDERRRLYRPTHREYLRASDLEDGRWREVDEAAFAIAWACEISKIPEFRTSSFYLVTGLLLPIWKDLPEESIAVRRLQTVDGQSLLGRLLHKDELSATLTKLGAGATVSMTPDELSAAILDRGAVAELAGGLTLRRVRVMGGERVEATGFAKHQLEKLKSLGAHTEIANYRLAVYVPTSRMGAVTDAFPIIQCTAR